MNTALIIQIMLRNINILCAFLICYLPMRGVRKVSVRCLTGICSILIVWLAAVSVLVAGTGIIANVLLFISFPVLFFLYYLTLDTSWYKALSVFCITIALFSFSELYTCIYAARTHSSRYFTDYDWYSSVFSFCLSMVFVVIFWLPASVHIRWMIEHFHDKHIWKNLIVWTVIFIILTNFIIPMDYSNLYRKRFFEIYLLIVTFLFFCMLYMYYLLYQSARSSDNLLTLERQNQFLNFQSRQYHLLTKHMEDTRRLRHDFRHQLLVITKLANQKDLDSLQKYLAQYQTSVAEEYTPICANPAVDALFSYYDNSCRELDISISWAVNLPESLPIPEPDYCVMAGNLLENAIDACLSLPEGEGRIQVISHMATGSMLVLMIENNHSNVIQEKEGRFVSSKHSNPAVGIASVEETVNLYQGNMRIQYDEKMFSVNIMLNT